MSDERNKNSNREKLARRGQENISNDTEEIQTNLSKEQGYGNNGSISTSNSTTNARGEVTTAKTTINTGNIEPYENLNIQQNVENRSDFNPTCPNY